MITQKVIIILLIFLSMIVNIPVALCAQTIYVSGDSTGTYKCDGRDDQVQINQALEYAANHPGTKVYLKGKFTYDIRGSCLIGSNTELTGDSTAKLRLANRVGWTKVGASTPIIGQRGGTVHDIKIHGFEIDGNEGAQSGPAGQDLYRLISFQGSSNSPVYNIRVYNMNLHDGKGEGFRVTNGKGIYYYSNTGANLQHTVVMYSRVIGGEISNNVARHCSCAADRLDSCQDITIANEKISPYSGTTTYTKNRQGYAVSDNGIQIGNIASSTPTKNIVIKSCNIMSGVDGISLDGLNDGSNVNIYSNVIHDCGFENEGVSRNGGIAINRCGNGITIRNNDLIGSYIAGININSAVSGTRTVTISNNNIMNGKSGYAIKNSVPSNVKLSLKHNYISGYKAPFYPSSIVNTNGATSLNSKLGAETTMLKLPFTENLGEYIKKVFEGKFSAKEASSTVQYPTQMNPTSS